VGGRGLANHVEDSNDGQYKLNGAKQGYTVKARLPQRYLVNKGQALNPQATIDTTVDITLTDQANVGLEFSMASLTMEMDNYREKCIAPAVDALVNTCDFDGLTRMYKKTFMTVGTPGVIPGSTGTLPFAANIVYQAAVVKLAKAGVNTTRLKAMLEPNMHAYLSGANFTLFNPGPAISKLYRTGQFGGEALGISQWFMTQNIPTHTVGQLGGTPLVDGVPTEGAASVLTKDWTSAAANRLKEGDIIQFAGCYAINPLNYQSTGQLQDFTVTSDTASSSGGAATIPISPSLITVGALATVDSLPADSVAVTAFAHASSYASKQTPQGVVYAPGAYTLVFADLEKPGGLWVAERISNKALGIAIRFLKDYSIMTDQSPARLDIMYGWAAVRPEMACRVCSG